jgi:predicted RNA-binding Zn-ribbon protein involved in translation (DUF1610 family)
VSSYPRPTEPTLSVEKEPVEGACPECGEAELRRYPVLSEEGWMNVVKCQVCLYSVEREPGARLGPVELLVNSL